ncbi:MAG: diguanylate cyclase [Actinomycetota bacterium]|nr:diguanylate cyclase [Actinomycetota bacterium]
MPTTERAVEQAEEAYGKGSVDSYKRLAAVFHQVLSEQSLDALLDAIADTIADLVPYDTLTIYEADEAEGTLTPVLARDQWAEQILNSVTRFGRGLTGHAAAGRQAIMVNDAHLDPRTVVVPGTPAGDPESILVIPLIARNSVKGVLNIYRLGESATFTEDEFELAKRFGDAAALALDNAKTRAILEHQAQTDSLTGLYNHRFFQERLRAELARANRSHDSIALLMFDIDDFKKVNDVYGHVVGDQVLQGLGAMLKSAIRTSDVVCRIGGEEFAVIMPSCDAGDATGFASRLMDGLASMHFEPAGKMTVSVGIAQGPEHAMNPTELVACSEAAMMTAKARGKNVVVLFEDSTIERPGIVHHRGLRSLAHMKMLQSLAGKLNRLNDVREIGTTITNELRTLIDYHSCRVYMAEGRRLLPIAFRGEFVYEGETPEVLVTKIGEGVTGRVAETGRSLLIPNATECAFSVTIPGTPEIDESMIAVPLSYGTRVIGVVTISKLGLNQFDEDDMRVLEVLAAQASVAMENARLYEAQRREANNAKALLEFADTMSRASSFHGIGNIAVRLAADLLNATHVSLWLQNEPAGDISCSAHCGYAPEADAQSVVSQRIDAKIAQDFVGAHRAPFIIHPGDGDPFRLTGNGQAVPCAIAPLQHAEGLTGWLVVVEPHGNESYFTEELLRFLAGLAYQTSVALQKALLYRAQKESAEISNALLDFSRGLVAAEGLDQVLNRTVELAARIVGSPRTSLWMSDLTTGDMVVQASWGYNWAERGQLARLHISPEVKARMGVGDDPMLLGPERTGVVEGLLDSSDTLTFAVSPIQLEGGRNAALVAGAPAYGEYQFSERKMRLLAGIADQAKLALDNAMSFDNLERTFVSTVEALANALEAKDEYTSAHARSIKDMAVAVGEEMALDAATLKRLELGALFHDIGKIGIRADILLKPGPLTDDERKTMETHPALGEQILAPIERLKDVRPVVRHCHERWDGKGYPDQIKAEAIPLEARIVFVCDAFHAMTTDRVYRKKLPIAEALRRLKEGAGSQFDPEVVARFLHLIETRRDFAAGLVSGEEPSQSQLSWIEDELLRPA